MKIKTKLFTTKNLIFLFTALTLLATIFIFSNSLKNIEDSTTDSNAVIEFVKPILEVVVDTDTIDMHFFIRKAAHLTEFAALGFSVWCLLNEVKKRWERTFYGFGFMYGISVAVIDEYIQSFSDRTSSVSDVLVDFSGFLIGVVVAALIILLIRAIKNKRMHFAGKGK